MKTEEAVATAGGCVGALAGLAGGATTVVLAEKIAELKPWQKALLVATISGLTGGATAAISYVAYSAVKK